MTNKISGFTRPNTDAKPAGTLSSGKSSRAESAGASETQAQRHDEVSLTDTATRLKTIEARIGELPDVDSTQVDQLRQLIESGDFEIDAKLVARRLAELEQLLF